VRTGVLLIPALILLSGAVAYVGNLVGRATGRRRLSLFGLRPRHTAHLITVLTGMLITLISLGSMLLVSQDARVGLFRLDELRQEIANAEARLAALKGGDIAYLRNQEVLREIVDGRLPPAQITERIDAMRLRAVDLAAGRGVAPDLLTGVVLRLDPPNLDWDAIARLIARRNAETVVRIVSLENALRGESLRVSVLLVDRRLVFPRGTVLLSGIVDGQAPREQVGRDLLALVDTASERAQDKLLSPPFALVTEPPRGQVDIDMHRAAVAEIIRRGTEVRVQVVAFRDLYTEMPLVVRFAILP
jgi:uncharacterized protein (DUF3084 family)